MILIDTGYLIALAIERDELHGRSIRWAAHTREPLLLSEYVLWETINRLSAVADRPRAHILAERVMSDPVYEFVRATPAVFDAGMALHRARPDKDWSLTDCISFHLMGERRISRALEPV